MAVSGMITHQRGEDNLVYTFVRTFDIGDGPMVVARRRQWFHIGGTQAVKGAFDFIVTLEQWSNGTFVGPTPDVTEQTPPPVEVTEDAE